ncbi:MAG: hypothetical protein M1822_004191 [Bathelium mastoideum]|nr:MAG: hypothetical protein M1822_004191 [Bathelium mastoideum]
MAASPSHGSPTRLPSGECSYRNLGLGTAALTCGCNRFWVDESRLSFAVEGTGPGASNDGRQTPWCVCGHHACYHKDWKKSAAETLGIPSTIKTPPGQTSLSSQDSQAVYVQYVRPTQDGRMQLVAGSPIMTPTKPRMGAPEALRHNGMSATRNSPFQSTVPQQSAGASQPVQQSRNTVTTQMLSNVAQTRPFPSPRLTAIQRLEGSRPSSAGSQRPRASSSQDQRRDLYAAAQKQSNAGLGLNFALPGVAPSLPSTTNSAHGGELPDWARLLKEFNDKPSSNSTSTTAEMQRISPNTALLQRASQQRAQERGQLLPPVATGYTFAYDRVAEEQSATEVATPSIHGTPDLQAFENALNEVRGSVEQQATAAATDPPVIQASSNPNAVVSSLQRLLPHLSAIQDYMASMPHESIRHRLDALETGSFNQSHVDQLAERYDIFEGHLIDLQDRVKEQSNQLSDLQAEGSSRQHRLLPAGNEAVNASFASNSSGQSATSSALVVSAIDRQTEARINDVEDRVSQLETALPSFAHPLEIEVVFLPWGRDLKGLWFSPDNGPGESAAFTTQESEEWTQAINSAPMGPSLHQSGHSGWSSDDIHGWADSTDEWLCARACGPKGIVYQRLRSRGFVRNIELRRSGAREFQSALRSAFVGLSQYFPVIEADEVSQPLGDPSSSTSFLGLRRPFVPLRKLHKSSRLRFLSTSEMLTPAIWTAEFLMSSIIMRAQGGQKRLFITNADAYLQHKDHDGSNWTWQKLRELPRITSPEAPSEAGVGEADAKEACWNHHPNYDPQQSLTSSFSSVRSSHVSRASIRGTPPPTSRQGSQVSLDQKRDEQAQDESALVRLRASSHAHHRYPPITPLTDLSPRHRRTASAPGSEHATALAALTPTTTKRRLISFDSAPHPRSTIQLSRRTSALSVQSGSSYKRRRISGSPEVERNAVAAAQGFTPRRSKEPPSPFYPASSQGLPLPRSQGYAGDQGAAGPSTTRGSWDTPVAYATPYSGGQARRDGPINTQDVDAEIGSAMVEDQEEAWEGVTEANALEHPTTGADVPHVETIELSSVNQNTDYLDLEDDSNGEEVDDDEEDHNDSGMRALEAVFDGRQFGH